MKLLVDTMPTYGECPLREILTDYKGNYVCKLDQIECDYEGCTQRECRWLKEQDTVIEAELAELKSCECCDYDRCCNDNKFYM